MIVYAQIYLELSSTRNKEQMPVGGKCLRTGLRKEASSLLYLLISSQVNLFLIKINSGIWLTKMVAKGPQVPSPHVILKQLAKTGWAPSSNLQRTGRRPQ